MLGTTPVSLAATTVARPSPPAVAFERNPALDFTKGALVLCMVAYHTLNYFRYDVNLLRHLHFLPPSFIFIAGFLITHLYHSKIRAGDRRVPQRLLVRGLKTLALFIGLNVAVHSLVDSTHNRHLGLGVLLDHIDVIFLDGQQRASVFGVLLPISYLLLLSAILLPIAQRVRYAIHLVAGGTFVLCLLLEPRGLLAPNLDLVSMGLLGMLFGFASRAALDLVGKYLLFLVLAYLGYSLAVRFRYPTYAMNTVGVCLSLLLLYAVGLRFASNGMVGRSITLLGNYSLLSYLAQIAILQLLFRICRHFGVLTGDIVVPFFATTVLTLGCITLTDALRHRFGLADRAYKMVFV